MGKVKFLTLAGIFGISGLTYAGSLQELKQLLGGNDVDIQMAITADYLYTGARNDSINGTSGYEDQFAYNAFLGVYKEATKENPIGFGLGIGNEWYPVVGSEPLPSECNQVKIHTAYIEAKTDVFTITAGRILTNIGGEAPFTWQNVNIQRGLVWNGEPVFYNGIRLSTTMGGVNLYAGVNDRDTSDGKMALEAGASATINKYLDASFNVLIPDHSDENNVQVYNLTLNINAIERLPLTLYFDYLYKDQSKADDAQGFGAALLGEFKATDKFSIGGRIEYVKDDKNASLYGLTEGINKDNDAVTFTITPKYQVNKYFYVRGEVSYVDLDEKVYQKDDTGTLKDNEFRAGVELGFVF